MKIFVVVKQGINPHEILICNTLDVAKKYADEKAIDDRDDYHSYDVYEIEPDKWMNFDRIKRPIYSARSTKTPEWKAKLESSK
ncbi:MAG: hypothetical protein PHS84_09820 [Paludibacter sp.]|nr:hypothetical protein [Paludibacter sp.]